MFQFQSPIFDQLDYRASGEFDGRWVLQAWSVDDKSQTSILVIFYSIIYFLLPI